MNTFDHFQKVDIRTGAILEAKVFEKARKPAYQLLVDFGELGIKRSSAQITDYYRPEELVNRRVLAVVNFGKKQIANFFSECLVLGVLKEDGKVILLKTDGEVQNGSRVC